MRTLTPCHNLLLLLWRETCQAILVQDTAYVCAHVRRRVFLEYICIICICIIVSDSHHLPDRAHLVGTAAHHHVAAHIAVGLLPESLFHKGTAQLGGRRRPFVVETKRIKRLSPGPSLTGRGVDTKTAGTPCGCLGRYCFSVREMSVCYGLLARNIAICLLNTSIIVCSCG